MPYWRVKAARGRSWKRALGAHRTNCPPELCWYWQFRPFAVGYGKSFQKDKKKTRGPHESLERNYALMCVERSSDMFFTQWMCWVSVFSSLFCFFYTLYLSYTSKAGYHYRHYSSLHVSWLSSLILFSLDMAVIQSPVFCFKATDLTDIMEK